MSTQQPEALRLSNALDQGTYLLSMERSATSAELNRLHLVNSELLEALELCEGNIDSLLASAHPKVFGTWLDVVRTAIAKAKGDKA